MWELSVLDKSRNTGIPRFTLLMWGLKKKTEEVKTAQIKVTLVVLKGREIG